MTTVSIKRNVVVGKITNNDNKTIIRDKYLNTLMEEIKYVNLTERDLLVCRRDGSISILPPQIGTDPIGVLVIGHTTHNPNGKTTMVPGIESDVSNVVRSELGANGGKGSYWEEQISFDDINNSRNGVYIKNADVVVATDLTMVENISHPMCTQVIHNEYLNPKGEFCPKSSINIGIRLVDNTSKSHSRYIIFHDRVMYLAPIVDDQMPSGLYISGLTELNGDLNGMREDKHYSIEEMDSNNCPVQIFSTKALANLTLAKIVEDQTIDKVVIERMEKEHRENMMELKIKQETSDVEWYREKRELEIETKREDLTVQNMQREKDQLLNELKYLKERESLRFQTEQFNNKTNQTVQAGYQREIGDFLKLATLLLGGGFALSKVF